MFSLLAFLTFDVVVCTGDLLTADHANYANVLTEIRTCGPRVPVMHEVYNALAVTGIHLIN
jgi:hypothetical protein